MEGDAVTMQVATLDILIEKAHFDPQVARAIAEAIVVENRASREDMATRQDMKELKGELREEMAELKSELKTEIHSVKSDLSRHLYTAMLGQMAALLGIVYFLMTYVLR